MDPELKEAIRFHVNQISGRSRELLKLLDEQSTSKTGGGQTGEDKPAPPAAVPDGGENSSGAAAIEGIVIPPSRDIPGRRRKVALIVGHDPVEAGAANKTYGVSEFEFNNQLVHLLANKLKPVMDVEVVYRQSAPAGLRALPGKVNALNPDFSVSFHANAYNRVATGSEVLYYKGSSAGKQLAGYLLEGIIAALELPNRGLKWRHRNASDPIQRRGAHILGDTKAPCALVEPFFIDNDSDFVKARALINRLVSGYSTAIIQFAKVATR